MDLKRAEQLANELITKHGIDQKGYIFNWSRAKKAAGYCDYRVRQIQLSKPLTELAEEVDVTDTILHEIAHAIAGPGNGHNWKWKQIARSIGCNGYRCYNDRSKPSTYKAAKELAKYIGVCPNGHESFRHRLPKHKVSCGKCSNRFNEKYLITFSLNM